MDIFYIVRFSLRLNSDWEIKTFGGDVNRECWFEFRSKVLANTIYASIVKQTVPGCKIILLLDKDDKDLYERYFDLKNVFPVFSEKSNFMDDVISIVQKNRDYPDQKIIISRVDSDDILAPDYTEKVFELTASPSENENFWIVSTDGARFDLNSYQRIYYAVSPFISYVSHDGKLENVYGFNHENISEKSNVKYLQSHAPIWCQILHGSNVANSFWAASTEDDFLLARAENRKASALSLKSVDMFNSEFSDFTGLTEGLVDLVKNFKKALDDN
ncbi:glycosyltransferase [Alteromonas abrolhosensis]|uniref:glycosyltransferase n=1 Tax=Alteromonas abrolhosensis TaxID=1892904 RepID=UPI0035110C55